MLLGSKKDKDTDARVRSANGITETRGGAQKAQSSKYRGGGSSTPKAPGNWLRMGESPEPGAPRLRVQGSS